VVPDSPAAQVGIQPGDRILTVADDPVETWADLLLAIGTRPDRDVALTLLRGGQTRSLTVKPTGEGRYEIGNIGVLPDTHPIVDYGPGGIAVIPGSPAERAGLQVKDEVISINGERVYTGAQFRRIIESHGDREMRMLIRRGGVERQISATPELKDGTVQLGIYIGELSREFTPGPVEALRLSVERNIESSGLIFRTLGGLFTGDTPIRQLQGPVGIAQMSGEYAEGGFIALLSFMAMLSINLGILNLMPVPVLDGGHIVILMLEGIARRDFSMRVKEKMLLAGFVVLMMLIVTVIYHDLTRITWIENLMPWRN
jgi:regulator of sigma E protease